MIDRLAEDGYAQVGYEYVVIDDCWMAKTRDYHTNRLVADPQRFPSGETDLEAQCSILIILWNRNKSSE